jgi:alpha-ketoglutarate-dependent taurine dioxygenase
MIPIITPTSRNRSLLRLNPQDTKEMLSKNKALLFRGFQVDNETFCLFTEMLSKNFSTYQGGAFERDRINGKKDLLSVDKIKSGKKMNINSHANKYLRDKSLPLHGEMYYQKIRPELLWFYCEIPPTRQGQTTICDAAKLFQAISPTSQKLLLNNNLEYTRWYTKKDWKTRFQVDTYSALTEILRQGDFKYQLLPDGRLETRYVCPAILFDNDQTPLCINNIATVCSHELLHMLLGRRRDSIVRFESGRKIPFKLYAELLWLSRKLSWHHQWQKNDILLIENKQFLHGRKSVKKDNRKINVRMADYMD